MSSWAETVARRKQAAAQPQPHARPLPGAIAAGRAAPPPPAPVLDPGQIDKLVAERVKAALGPIEGLVRQAMAAAPSAASTPPGAQQSTATQQAPPAHQQAPPAHQQAPPADKQAPGKKGPSAKS